MKDYFKSLTKEELIEKLEEYIKENNKLTAQNYSCWLSKDILTSWIKLEIANLEKSEERQTDNKIITALILQRMILERTLREVEYSFSENRYTIPSSV